MTKSFFRSARTGRYITSGRYVTETTANRWPSRTVTENGS